MKLMRTTAPRKPGRHAVPATWPTSAPAGRWPDVSKKIYVAVDVTTDSHVMLEHNPTPWTSWDVTVSPLVELYPFKVRQFDSLVNAAHAVADAVDSFQDYDAPDAEGVLASIANHFDDPDKIYVMSEEPDGGGIFLVNEYEWDDHEEED